MRILDAFAGIGGFTMASSKSDVTIGFIENNPKCQLVLQQAFPGIPLHSNIRDFQGIEFGEFDLLTGGFPCQPFSRCGKSHMYNNQTICNDDRANLCFELIRLLRDVQPKAFLFENVKEVLTIHNPDGSSFLELLMSELQNVGYSVKYRLISPTSYGVPQQRNRVYFVGLRQDLPRQFKFPEPPDYIPSRILDYMDNVVDAQYTLASMWRTRRMRKSVGTRLDALVKAYNSGLWPVPTGGYTMCITPVGIIYGDTPSNKARQHDKLYSVYGWSPTVTTIETHAFDHPAGWRMLTPIECLRLQSFPDSHPIGQVKRDGYQQVGNSVNVRVVRAIIDQIRGCI